MTLQLVVFALYFGALFIVGYAALRATRTSEDYWIAGGRLGWLVGGATMAATHASAGTFIGTIGVMHGSGFAFGWLVLSIPIAYWFIAAVLAPRFTRQREITLPAFLERRYYSRRVRVLGAAIVLVATVVYIQAQVVAGGLIANVILGVPIVWGMVGFTVVLVVYTMVGGMIAVVYTDLIQLVVMVVGAALAVPLTLRHLGGIGATLELAEAVNPQAFEWGSLPASLLVTMGLAFTLGTVATPEKLVRLYAMRDMSTIRRGVLLAIVVATGLNLLIFLLALASSALFPVLPTGDLAMPLIARAALPPILGAVLLAAITAAMMSTVDSLLLVAAAAVSQDLYPHWFGEPAAGHRRWLDRGAVVVTGSVPLILLLSGVGEGELVQFIVLLFTALMAASFFMPVVGGVLWERATREGAVAAMLGGVTSTFAWKLWGSAEIHPALPGFLVSAVLFVAVSLSTAPPPEGAVAPYRVDDG